MSKTGIKSELHDLIDQETDVNILRAIKTILEKTHLDPTLKEQLTRRALCAEEDIENDRTVDRDQAFKKTDRLLDV